MAAMEQMTDASTAPHPGATASTTTVGALHLSPAFGSSTPDAIALSDFDSTSSLPSSSSSSSSSSSAAVTAVVVPVSSSVASASPAIPSRSSSFSSLPLRASASDARAALAQVERVSQQFQSLSHTRQQTTALQAALAASVGSPAPRSSSAEEMREKERAERKERQERERETKRRRREEERKRKEEEKERERERLKEREEQRRHKRLHLPMLLQEEREEEELLLSRIDSRWRQLDQRFGQSNFPSSPQHQSQQQQQPQHALHTGTPLSIRKPSLTSSLLSPSTSSFTPSSSSPSVAASGLYSPSSPFYFTYFSSYPMHSSRVGPRYQADVPPHPLAASELLSEAEATRFPEYERPIVAPSHWSSSAASSREYGLRFFSSPPTFPALSWLVQHLMSPRLLAFHRQQWSVRAEQRKAKLGSVRVGGRGRRSTRITPALATGGRREAGGGRREGEDAEAAALRGPDSVPLVWERMMEDRGEPSSARVGRERMEKLIASIRRIRQREKRENGGAAVRQPPPAAVTAAETAEEEMERKRRSKRERQENDEQQMVASQAVKTEDGEAVKRRRSRLPAIDRPLESAAS